MLRLLTSRLPLAGALLVLSATLLSGQQQGIVNARGSAKIGFGAPKCATPEGMKRGQPIPECRAPAEAEVSAVTQKAVMNALERMMAEQGSERVQAFDRMRDTIVNRLGDIVLSTTELFRTVDPATRTIEVGVRIELNNVRFTGLIQQAAGSGAQVATRPGSRGRPLGVFLLARDQESVEQFAVGTRREAAVDASASRTASATRTTAASAIGASTTGRQFDGTTAAASDRQRGDEETIDGVRGSTTARLAVKDESQASENRSVTAKTQAQVRDSVTAAESARRVETTSASSIRRADQITYRVTSSQDLDGALGQRLQAAGFRAVEADFFEDEADPPLLETVRGDFAGSDNIRAATLRRVIASARANDVRYVLIGTVDAALPTLDQVSGNQSVIAKVSAKVYDLTEDGPPITIVNVGPAQYRGLGPSGEVARVNALKAAADVVARTVVDAMNALPGR